MPGRKKKLLNLNSPIAQRLALALGVAVLAYGTYMYGSIEANNFHNSMAQAKGRQFFHDTKVMTFYNIVKADAAGVGDESTRLNDDYFARHLSSELHSKYKIGGPAVLFCADRSPDTISTSQLAGGNSGVIVRAQLFNGPGKEATSKAILVAFEESNDPHGFGLDDKISEITCP